MTLRTLRALNIGLLIVSGCCAESDFDSLSASEVTAIPAGDGIQEASMSLELELLTTGCTGLCGVIQLTEGVIISNCDVGMRERVTADIVVRNGVATFDVRGSERLARLDGAAFADGSFDVGGVRSYRGEPIPMSLGTNPRIMDSGTFRGRIMGDLDTPRGWLVRTAVGSENYACGATPSTNDQVQAPCIATYEVL